MTRCKFVFPAERFSTCSIYALCDPVTNEIRYVGKSMVELRRRVSQHTSPYWLKKKSRKNTWLKSLYAAGQRPEVVVLEHRETEQDLNEAERFYVAYFRSIGVRLTNHTDGGEGAPGYTFSAEQKQALSDYWTDRPRGPASDDKKIACSRGKGGRRVIDSNGTMYETAAAAARAVGVCPQDMNAVLKGRMHSTANRRFRYEDEEFAVIRQKGRPVIDEDGVVYATAKDCARALGISLASVSNCVNGKIKAVKGKKLRWAI